MKEEKGIPRNLSVNNSRVDNKLLGCQSLLPDVTNLISGATN